MKQGKRPTVAQRKQIEAQGLDPRDWLVAKDTPEKTVLVHRYVESTTRTIPKG